MPQNPTHETVSDVSRTLGGIVERLADEAARGFGPRFAKVVTDAPSPEAIETARARRAFLVSVILFDVVRVSLEERGDEETHPKPPSRRTKLSQRYLVTPWSGDPVLDLAVLARLDAACSPFLVVAPELLVGASLKADAPPLVHRVDDLAPWKLAQLWERLARPPTPSAVWSALSDGPLR